MVFLINLCEQLSHCQSCSVSLLHGPQRNSVPGVLGLSPKEPFLISFFVFSVSGDYSRQPTFSNVNIESSDANVSLADQKAVLVNIRPPEG